MAGASGWSSCPRVLAQGYGLGNSFALPICHRRTPFHFSRWLLQRVGIDGHLAQALSRRRIDRIGDGGDDARGRGFSHAARRLRTLDDMNLDFRRLVHADHLVGVEVGLLDTAVLQRDLTIERSRGAKGYSAHELRLDSVRRE